MEGGSTERGLAFVGKSMCGPDAGGMDLNVRADGLTRAESPNYK